MCGSDVLSATELLLSPPSLTDLFRKIRETNPLGERVRIEVDEEDEHAMFSDAAALYKSPQFNFCSDLRVRFMNQPAVDTGGVRRQLFTDTFRLVATSSRICLMEGELPAVHFRYSVQNVMSGLAEILGKMIAHAIVLEESEFRTSLQLCTATLPRRTKTWQCSPSAAKTYVHSLSTSSCR